MAKNNRGYFAHGFISCKCKTPYAKSSMERSNIATSTKLTKTARKQDISKTYGHAYKVTKGTRMQIGSTLNDCKCSIFSGKDRTRSSNRKDKSFVRSRKLKAVNSILVNFG
jgi:hypothetical protein